MKSESLEEARQTIAAVQIERAAFFEYCLEVIDFSRHARFMDSGKRA